MENVGSPKEANASNPVKVAFDLSNKPMLRQKQLEAIGLMSRLTTVGGLTHDPVEYNKSITAAWNTIPLVMRNNPKLITVVIKGHQYFDNTHRVSIDINTLIKRLSMLQALMDVKFGDKLNTNLLSYIGKNSQIIQDTCAYNANRLIELINRKSYINHLGIEVLQDYTVTDNLVCEQIINQFVNVNSVNRWFQRINYQRNCAKRHSADLLENRPIQERFASMLSNITTVRPMHWNRSLNKTSLAIASRLRPTGECLGIELEFVAEKGSDIVNWDSDDYPKHPWLYFKGDGSIRTNSQDEALANYQELTWFINGSSNMDWKNLKQVMSEMTSNGAHVNNSCGTHVHLDMRHRTDVSAARTATKVRDAINTWAHRTVSFTRSNNHYCGIHREHQGNRYTAVNTQCISEHKTIEIRLGMPTLNFYKLKYWCMFMQYLAKPYTSVSSFEDFMQSDAPADLKHYVFNRILKFSPTYVDSLPNFDNYKIAMGGIDTNIE